MIRPPLPRLRDGDVLGLGLVNGIINRVEYAADLLRQGKPVAGDGTNIQTNYNGSIISSKIEGITETLCGYYQRGQDGIIGFIYSNGIFTDLPNPSGDLFSDTYFGISQNRVCGTIYDYVGQIQNTYGFIYSNNNYSYYQYLNTNWTEFYSIRKNQIVGFTEVDSMEYPENRRGFYFNTSTGQQSSTIFPYSSFGIDGFRTTFQDIYENKIIGDYYYINPGGQSTSVGTFIYENGSWQQANYPGSSLSTCFTIYNQTIFGVYKNSFSDSPKIYMNQGGQFTTNTLLTELNASYLKLKNTRLAGTMIDLDDGIRKGFVYDINTGQLTKIQHPLAGAGGTYVTGID